jgi:hypothetical protein
MKETAYGQMQRGYEGLEFCFQVWSSVTSGLDVENFNCLSFVAQTIQNLFQKCWEDIQITHSPSWERNRMKSHTF